MSIIMATPGTDTTAQPGSSSRWQDEALCAGMDPDLFFPERGDMETVNAAKAVCAGCPVRSECLELGIHEKFGIWGGTTERERRILRRSRRSAERLIAAS